MRKNPSLSPFRPAALSLALAAALACPAALSAFADDAVAPTEEAPAATVEGAGDETSETGAVDGTSGTASSENEADTGSDAAGGEDGIDTGDGADYDASTSGDSAGTGESDAGTGPETDASGTDSGTDAADGTQTDQDATTTSDVEAPSVMSASLTDAEAAAQAASTTSEETTTYAHSESATQNGVTFTVQWNDSTTAGEATTFHVTQTGGSSVAQARMDVPTYWDNDSQESVCDPTRQAWGSYATIGDGYDFTFELTASGTYCIYFYFMDTDNSITYLRALVSVTVDDAARPSVSQIVADAVAQAKAATDGSEYAMALWLHDWTLDQLEYDYSLNYCSAESGLTRAKGTCESYQRIYAKLLDAAGIANGRVTGNGHTWNAVKIDGKWCQMDLTWDDTDDTWYGDFDQRHIYFGLTDELMAIAHSDHIANYQASGYAYRSTDLSNNYFVRNGKADEWADTYTERIQTHLDAGETEFSIVADNIGYPPSIYGIQNGIIAYQLNQKTGWSNSSGSVMLSAVAQGPAFIFTANYSYGSCLYEVSDYKQGTDPASWTAPTLDGYAFAGWYSDEACTETFTATSGQAYARFVPVSGLVRFTGCSLRDDGAGPDAATLRFCYEFAVPGGCRLSGAGWRATNAKTGNSADFSMKSYWLSGGDAAVANLTLVGIKRDGEKSSFSSEYSVLGSVSYTTPDGTAVSAPEASAHAKSVLGAAADTVSGGAASEAAVAYAQTILDGSDAGDTSTDTSSGVTCLLYVPSYKTSSDSSTWQVPTLDGYAFAGWYTTSACTTAYTSRSGYAYARFVPVSGLVRFTGCSLRDDGAGPDAATLRFCYEFAVPGGCRLSGAGWRATNAKTGNSADFSMKSYWLSGGDAAVANLTLVGIKRDGEKSSFSSEYSVLGSVSYTTPDGTAVSAPEASAHAKSVLGAAADTVSGGAASEAAVAYARDILGQS